MNMESDRGWYVLLLGEFGRSVSRFDGCFQMVSSIDIEISKEASLVEQLPLFCLRLSHCKTSKPNIGRASGTTRNASLGVRNVQEWATTRNMTKCLRRMKLLMILPPVPKDRFFTKAGTHKATKRQKS